MLTEDDDIQPEVSEALFALEEDVFITAKQSFNFKEFEKTAFILRECRSPKARFLCLYSKFLVRSRPSLYTYLFPSISDFAINILSLGEREGSAGQLDVPERRSQPRREAREPRFTDAVGLAFRCEQQ